MSGFAPPRSFRGTGDLRTLLESNWRHLTTYLNSGAARNGDWVEPTLENSWTNFGSGHANAAYRVLEDGRVELRGLVTGGTDHTTIFTLPVALRPPAHLIVACVTNAGLGRLNITSGGSIDTDATSPTLAAHDWVSLSGIVFSRDE